MSATQAIDGQQVNAARVTPVRLGNYRISRRIERLRDFSTFQASSSAGEPVLLRIFAPQSVHDSARLIRFYSDAKAAMLLEDPNVPRVTEVGEADSMHFAACEYTAAISLQSRFANRSSSPKEAVAIVRKLAETMQRLHSAGTVSGALNSENVLLSDEGEPLVTAFGPTQRSARDGDFQLPGIISRPLEMQFQSPEQTRGDVPRPTCDVYSLGALFFFLLTGETPFAGRRGSKLRRSKQRCELPDLMAAIPDLTRGMQFAIRQSLAPDADKRISSAAEFADMLSGNEQRIGGFRLMEQLAVGTASDVFRALGADGREFALKVLREDRASHANRVERFHDEARLARRVDDTNVVNVVDSGIEDGKHFVAMELVNGDNLGWILKQRGRLPLSEAVRVTIDVAKGLSALHRAGIVHRDLKPVNVLIDETGRAVLADLGAAGVRESGHGELNGAPAAPSAQYMAPEQLVSQRKAEYRTDVYALGAMLYRMVTGRVPFDGKSRIDLYAAKMSESWTAIGETACINPGLARLIEQCLSSKPASRPTTQEFIRSALDTLRPAEPTMATADEATNAHWDVSTFDRPSAAGAADVRKVVAQSARALSATSVIALSAARHTWKAGQNVLLLGGQSTLRAIRQTSRTMGGVAGAVYAGGTLLTRRFGSSVVLLARLFERIRPVEDLTIDARSEEHHAGRSAMEIPGFSERSIASAKVLELDAFDTLPSEPIAESKLEVDGGQQNPHEQFSESDFVELAIPDASHQRQTEFKQTAIAAIPEIDESPRRNCEPAEPVESPEVVVPLSEPSIPQPAPQKSRFGYVATSGQKHDTDPETVLPESAPVKIRPWQVSWTDEAGTLRRYQGSTVEVADLLARGEIAGRATARRSGESEFTRLSQIPEFKQNTNSQVG